MSRVIKFRAWDGDNMKYDWFNHSPEAVRLLKLNVMQFTGLQDKQGSDIYESDIVSSGRTLQGQLLAWEVVYHKDGFKIKDLGRTPHSVGYYFWNHVTVIGNIYQTPTLL